MPPAEVLRIEELTKVYGRKRALDGVSFTVREGDVFGFLGPNGAGKTTTIRIVLGLIRATSGRVFLFGKRRRGAALAALARLGAVVEIPRFYPYLSGRGNLEVLAMLSGVRSREAVDRVLAVVRLEEAADDPVRTYSQGMRQRLGIAQALLADPELVLLDEPTNGLDPHGVQEMREMIAELNRERGITFVISSHQLLEIEQICNRVAILRKGRLLVTGDVDRILSTETVIHRLVVDDVERAAAALGDRFPREEGPALRIRTSRDRVPEAVEALVRAGVRVREVVPERLTLEEYFLRVTEGSEVDLGR